MEVQVQAQEFATGKNSDSDDDIDAAAVKLGKKKKPYPQGERRRASLPTGKDARRMSAEGALPDVNADIQKPTRRASLRALDYMSGPATTTSTSTSKRRSSTAGVLETERRGSMQSVAGRQSISAGAKPRRASTGGANMADYMSAPIAPVSVGEKFSEKFLPGEHFRNSIAEEITSEIREDEN